MAEDSVAVLGRMSPPGSEAEEGWMLWAFAPAVSCQCVLALPLRRPALNSLTAALVPEQCRGGGWGCRCVLWSISGTQAERPLLAARCLPAVAQAGAAHDGGTLCCCARGSEMTKFFLALSHSCESSSVQDADHCPVVESQRGILKLSASLWHRGKEMSTLLQVSREQCKEVPATQLQLSGC